jgi:GTPase Era involved in 16S rRNA processing
MTARVRDAGADFLRARTDIRVRTDDRKGRQSYVHRVTDETTSLGELIALGMKAASAYDRPDLAERLETSLARVSRDAATVLVVGEFKAGKSSLVNALVGTDVCPVDDDVATAAITVVRHHDAPAAAAIWLRDGEAHTEVIAVEDAVALVVEDPAAERAELVRVELGVPNPLLERGLILVDTPGAGGLGGPQSALTMAATAQADAVLFVSSATQELTATEVAYLEQVRSLCETVTVVETKTDLQPQWRRIAAHDQVHVDAAQVGARVVEVSSAVRQAALQREDAVLDEESGVPALVEWLVDDVAAHQRQRSVRGAFTALLEVVEQLQYQLRAEHEALEADGEAIELVEALTRAESDAERAKSSASKWGQALTDGFADLTTTLDRDLRERLRTLVSDAEASLDTIDPARSWDGFERRLYEGATAAAAAHAQLRHARLLEIVATVAALFDDEDTADLAVLPDFVHTDAERPHAPDLKATGLLSQSLTLLRSSYGGIAMLGVFGGFAGVVLAAPVIAGLGLALGTKGLKDERDRQITQRRAQAKQAARKYIDDVTYALGNETRDVVRGVQRRLRDHFTSRAQEQLMTATTALAAARRAVELDTNTRERRQADVEAELQRVDRLEARVLAARDQ